MAGISFKQAVGSGDELLSFIENALRLPPELVRPGFISLRTDSLASGAATQSDTERVNSDYHFIWESMTGHVEPINVGTPASRIHESFVQIRESGRNWQIFDQKLSMSFLVDHWENTSALGGSHASASGLSGMSFKVPHVFRSGSDVTAEFTCNSGFGATATTVEVLLVGTYVHRDLELVNMGALSADEIRNLAARARGGGR